MVQSQFSLTWEGYKSNICSGFSSLQQNGEFVDMTLAADGHFVKVHQVLMALVSPYLRELIRSAPCPHPVIFLNNVSHKNLSSLLEYVYTGEVLVTSENLMAFVETAKALHISGLEDFHNPDKSYKAANTTSTLEESIPGHGIKRMSVPFDQGSAQVGLPAAARKVFIKTPAKQDQPKQESLAMDSSDMNYSDMMNSGIHDDSDDDGRVGDTFDSSSKVVEGLGDSCSTASSNLQFSVSIRGSLQVILNRYIYNLFSVTQRSNVRRWRCVDYRNHRCKAFLVTKGNIVLNRGNLHNHPFHDKKILQKLEKKSVFSALDDVQAYKEKEDALDNRQTEPAPMEDDDNYITIQLGQNDQR